MITEFTVKNFRCFRELTITPLKQVNLVAGKNNTGKTALLEALWLFHGRNNLDLPRRTQLFRGIYGGPPESIFENLFRDFNTDAPIYLRGRVDGEHRELAISLEEPKVFSTPITSGQPGEQGTSAGTATTSDAMPFGREAVFTYKDERDHPFISKGRFSRLVPTPLGPAREIGLQAEQSKVPDQPTGRFLYAYAFGNQNTETDNANRYSSIVTEKQDQVLVDLLKAIEPRIVDLRVVSEEGISSLKADVGLAKRMPVGLMGGGIVRLLSILLAIATAPKGLVLVDEIENGFHHEVLPKVWEAIATFVEHYKVQLFATTHSNENIRSAYELFANRKGVDFVFHRLDRVDDNVQAATYDLEAIRDTTELGFELR